MKRKQKPGSVVMENIRNRERWICDDLQRQEVIDGDSYIYVRRADNTKLFLMRRDSLKKVNS